MKKLGQLWLKRLSRTKCLTLALAALTFMVTGCPFNDYTVELKPQGKVMERTLTFYCADGIRSNGIPIYCAMDVKEVAAIAALYPTNGYTKDGERHIVRGKFTGVMPSDVGGQGCIQT